MKQVLLKLNPAPDTYGFLYGQARRGDELFNINVLPPRSQWRGHVKLTGFTPDEHDWIIYLDGEEVARAPRAAAVQGALKQALEQR